MKFNWKKVLATASVTLGLLSLGLVANSNANADSNSNNPYSSIIAELTQPTSETDQININNNVNGQPTNTSNSQPQDVSANSQPTVGSYRWAWHHMNKHFNYKKSSMTIPYPKHLTARKNSIRVSLKKQRAYLMRGKKVVYEFYVSTGKRNHEMYTPKGHYHIDGVRSSWFYAPSEHEGARYAVGWLDGGLYLFHETPSNYRGQIIKSVARDLGKRPSSHGCIHLSTPDARWFYYHIPNYMPVIIY